MTHRTEGGETAYCPECKEPGHYQTVHHTKTGDKQ